MKYLVFSSATDAYKRSAEIATALGCGRDPADITRFWYSVNEHALTKEGALAIDETESRSYNKLGAIEKATLIDKSVMDNAGWFPVRVVVDGVEVLEGIGGGGWFDDTTPPDVFGIPVASRITWLKVIQPIAKAVGL